jgi:hypothetical protein
MFPRIPIPLYLEIPLIGFAIVALTLTLKEKLYPITLEDIEKMNFKEIVEFLDSRGIASSGNKEWQAAKMRATDIWTPHEDAVLTKQFEMLIANEDRSEAMRFKVKIGLLCYGTLGPIT